MKKIGFIGCGNMGSSMARAFALSIKDIDLYLYDTDSNKSSLLASELSANAALSAQVSTSVESLIMQTDITFLAVKPQILPQLYSVLAKIKNNHSYISIAAGISIDSLSKGLNSNQVIRFMPNIAASVSKAVTAVASNSKAEEKFIQEAFKLAQACGTAFSLPEKLFPAFIGISGSAIAFFYQFLHAVALGGTKEGISYSQSLSIASQTFSGAIELLLTSGSSPQELITTVTSAAGTTIDGIIALEDGGMNAAVIKAVSAASGKARDLENS
ncbi:MAG: pyrroline-5-carboxylate reductase [Spirochaetales bacterium]|nr:pyrroline-5-carboxylate reductase [Spirochaetales bacterium]